MIVVTGAPRTGTSMMMQTLLELGFNTPAEKFIDEHKEIIDRNPKGFYEMTSQIINGIHTNEYKGQCIKLFPPELYRTNQDLVDKIIVCVRDKDSALNSYSDIHKILKQSYTPEEVYDMCYTIIDTIVMYKQHIFINFEDIISNQKAVIKEVCDFLKINPSQNQIDNAIKNIDYATVSDRSWNVST